MRRLLVSLLALALVGCDSPCGPDTVSVSRPAPRAASPCAVQAPAPCAVEAPVPFVLGSSPCASMMASPCAPVAYAAAPAVDYYGVVGQYGTILGAPGANEHARALIAIPPDVLACFTDGAAKGLVVLGDTLRCAADHLWPRPAASQRLVRLNFVDPRAAAAPCAPAPVQANPCAPR